MPVATTTPSPLPRVAAVPLKSMQLRSGSAAGAGLRRILLDGQRLARQGGLVHLKPRCEHETQIGGEHIAGLDQDDVARHQIVGGYDACGAFAANRRVDASELAKRLHRAPRAQLGDETDPRIGNEHDGDRQGLEPFVESQRDDGGHREQRHDRARQLVPEDAPGAVPPGFPQAVGPMALPTRRDLPRERAPASRSTWSSASTASAGSAQLCSGAPGTDSFVAGMGWCSAEVQAGCPGTGARSPAVGPPEPIQPRQTGSTRRPAVAPGDNLGRCAPASRPDRPRGSGFVATALLERARLRSGYGWLGGAEVQVPIRTRHRPLDQLAQGVEHGVRDAQVYAAPVLWREPQAPAGRPRGPGWLSRPGSARRRVGRRSAASSKGVLKSEPAMALSLSNDLTASRATGVGWAATVWLAERADWRCGQSRRSIRRVSQHRSSAEPVVLMRSSRRSCSASKRTWIWRREPSALGGFGASVSFWLTFRPSDRKGRRPGPDPAMARSDPDGARVRAS